MSGRRDLLSLILEVKFLNIHFFIWLQKVKLNTKKIPRINKWYFIKHFLRTLNIEPVNSVEHRLQSLKTSVIKLFPTGQVRPATNVMTYIAVLPAAPASYLSLFSWTGKRPPRMTSPGILAPLGERLSTKSEGDHFEPSILSGDLGVLFNIPRSTSNKSQKR